MLNGKLVLTMEVDAAPRAISAPTARSPSVRGKAECQSLQGLPRDGLSYQPRQHKSQRYITAHNVSSLRTHISQVRVSSSKSIRSSRSFDLPCVHLLSSPSPPLPGGTPRMNLEVLEHGGMSRLLLVAT